MPIGPAGIVRPRLFRGWVIFTLLCNVCALSGTAVAALPAAASVPISGTAAARLLDQTTFGPTPYLIKHVEQEGINAWLTEQFNSPQSVMPPLPYPFPVACISASYCMESEWWTVALTGNDQLRQRVAFALSEVFVVSDGAVHYTAVNTYANLLATDAFGNWSTIMRDVTLSTAMGNYLNMLNSAKGGDGQIANENYARENMQLFNLGLKLLHQDGTPILDENGNSQSVYTEAQVQAFARAYTGWTYAEGDGSTPREFIIEPNFPHPMVAVEKEHDESAKSLLNGIVLPAGQTAEADLSGALENIFEHPNLPPFVCKQLIQHLVTGNPSPGYISRVAAVFIDDGTHVRGNMRAVIAAILTDPEARAGDTDPTADAGHLREPILWMTGVMRGLGSVNPNPDDYYVSLSRWVLGLNERPYHSPSVFNFFPPSYVLPGTGLNEPEFALENTGSIGILRSLADRFMTNTITASQIDLSATSPLGQLAADPAQLVDALGGLFLHLRMNSHMRQAIINELAAIDDPGQRVRVAVYLVITSSEYKILH